MTLEQRVERLERDNRRLRRVVTALGCVGLAATGAFVGPSTVLIATAAILVVGATLAVVRTSAEERPSVLRATKLEIIGADGRTRVAVGETVDGVGAIAAYDAAGRCIAALPPARDLPSRLHTSKTAATRNAGPKATAVASTSSARAMAAD